jgi:hypothetical protein
LGSGPPVWRSLSKGISKQSTRRSPGGSWPVRRGFATDYRETVRSTVAPPYAAIGIESGRWKR